MNDPPSRLNHMNTGHLYCPVFRWIRYSCVRYSNGYCTLNVQVTHLTILWRLFRRWRRTWGPCPRPPALVSSSRCCPTWAGLWRTLWLHDSRTEDQGQEIPDERRWTWIKIFWWNTGNGTAYILFWLSKNNCWWCYRMLMM